jgi:GNAT superfamily N-acetyltransferase
MDEGAILRRLEPGDRPAAARLLDDAVGAGFWGFCEGAGDLSAVAVRAGDLAGVVVAALEPAGEEDVRLVFGPAGGVSPGRPVLHVRAVAVAPDARRAGLGRRLLAHAEGEAAGRGAPAAFLFAWLPAGRPEPPAVRLYEAAGYVAAADIPDFYAAGSVATGARCPYCGAPPCLCAARPYVKSLAPG